MTGSLLLVVTTALVLIITLGHAEKGLEFPTNDGKDRLINFSKKNFNRFLKKFDILVVYFTIPHDPRDIFHEKQWQMTKDMLELAAQITEREGIGFGVVDLVNDEKLAEKLRHGGNPGDEKVDLLTRKAPVYEISKTSIRTQKHKPAIVNSINSSPQCELCNVTEEVQHFLLQGLYGDLKDFKYRKPKQAIFLHPVSEATWHDIFEAGAIYVYKSGHKVEYDGQRSTDVLVEFLLELDEEPVEVINTRSEVVSFKRSELPKVVGYFESASANAYDEFVDAALDFQPMVAFYAVFEKQLAKQLGLSELNEIGFHEPYMKKPTTIPGELPLDNTVIEEYVSHHKRSTLRKLIPMNMYETWEDDINNIHVVVFADEGDPEGYEFLGVVKDVAQKHTDNEKLSIVWIDPDDFSLLHSYWEKTFGIDLKEPQIGVVNVTDADSVWMERRKSRLPTINEMDKWIGDVLAGKVNTEDDDDDYNLEEDDDDDDVDIGEENSKSQQDDDDDSDEEEDEKQKNEL